MKGIVLIKAVFTITLGLWLLVQGEISSPITAKVYLLEGWQRLSGVIPVLYGLALIWAVKPAGGHKKK